MKDTHLLSSLPERWTARINHNYWRSSWSKSIFRRLSSAIEQMTCHQTYAGFHRVTWIVPRDDDALFSWRIHIRWDWIAKMPNNQCLTLGSESRERTSLMRSTRTALWASVDLPAVFFTSDVLRQTCGVVVFMNSKSEKKRVPFALDPFFFSGYAIHTLYITSRKTNWCQRAKHVHLLRWWAEKREGRGEGANQKGKRNNTFARYSLIELDRWERNRKRSDAHTHTHALVFIRCSEKRKFQRLACRLLFQDIFHMHIQIDHPKRRNFLPLCGLGGNRTYQ